MNIEVYEVGVKKRSQEETVKLSKEEKLREVKETKEREIKTTRELCSDYHRDLDCTSYFDDKSMKKADDLLPKFERINLKLLPESLVNVVKHRMAYLKLMVALSKNSKFKKLMREFAPKTGDLGLLSGNYDAIKQKASKSSTFKSLNLDDFNEAITALRKANNSLKELSNGKGNWEKAAKKFLMPANERGKKDSRVDDLSAARNLQGGIEKLIKNVSRLRREREVLRKGNS
jgi:hypothetical protein